MNSFIYDVAGIGIGPFNLGLAALSAPTALQCIFFDSKSQFSWHPGLQLAGAKMQVPFLADLVTAADPTSQYSYLAFLKESNRLYQFTILEEPYILRTEYERYCRWVAQQLPSLRFMHTVTAIQHDPSLDAYELTVTTPTSAQTILARRLVIGIGTAPYIPAHLQVVAPSVVHAAQYLFHRPTILDSPTVTLVGSGQSAAEIFHDLQTAGASRMRQLNWCTRSNRFQPMETGKLTLEMTSPDYIHYFHHLTPAKRAHILAGQTYLYKGINSELIEAIYRNLYQQGSSDTMYRLVPQMHLQAITGTPFNHHLHFEHAGLDRSFSLSSTIVILATGYRNIFPSFLEGIREKLCLDEQGHYAVQHNYAVDTTGNRIFVQNAEMHTHGFNAPDLGMGPYRNAIILNTILGYTRYQIEERIAFQTFDPNNLFP